MEFVLFMLREIGVPGVPSMNHLKTFKLHNDPDDKAIIKVCIIFTHLSNKRNEVIVYF